MVVGDMQGARVGGTRVITALTPSKWTLGQAGKGMVQICMIPLQQVHAGLSIPVQHIPLPLKYPLHRKCHGRCFGSWTKSCYRPNHDAITGLRQLCALP